MRLERTLDAAETKLDFLKATCADPTSILKAEKVVFLLRLRMINKKAA